MSYLVLARKWRPIGFDDVVGQEHITATLMKAIEKDRVAHAYIFSGTRGVGKTTTARILARALNCEKGPTPTPCGVCDSCKGILGGSSFDVLEIDGASNNSVDDIRSLRETVGYSSMGGKYRIFVIDEVHMLSKSAFNALLKTLEEPPPSVIFIFATTEPQKIPATIHSRCQRYDFRRIGPEHILDRLIKICNAETITFEKSALMLVARKADGSMRDALSLLDQVYSFCHDQITEKEARGVLGLVGMEVFTTIMNAVAAKQSAPVLSAVQDVLYQGYDLHEFVLGFEEHIRNLLFSRIEGALAAGGIDKEVGIELSLSSARFTEGDLIRMMEIVRKSEQDLKWSALPRFTVELMLLKLVCLDSTVTLEKIISSLGVPQGAGAGQAESTPVQEKKKIELVPVAPGVPPGTAEPVALAAKPETDELSHEPFNGELAKVAAGGESLEPTPDFEEPLPAGLSDVKGRWPAFLEALGRDRPNIGAFLSLATIAESTTTSIDLIFSSRLKFQFSEVTKKQTRDEINSFLKTFFGTTIDLKIVLDTASEEPAGKNAGFSLQSSGFIETEIKREPIIQTVLDVFDGELLG